MYKALNAGAIKVNIDNLAAGIDAAKRHGYGGVEFNVHEVADLIDAQGVDAVRKMSRMLVSSRQAGACRSTGAVTPPPGKRV